KRGGILYIRVPDHDSYDRKSYGKSWPAYAQYHISNFSEKSLSLLYEQNGVDVLEIKKFFSDRINKTLTKLIQKSPLRHYLVNKLSGRTITIIGKKKTE
ncbi:MAG TPA: hypothetical protein VK750_07950, partial [Cytophagaceae bacterium]|nr:hypothetical protein [Cytophagaceae bacterium]